MEKDSSTDWIKNTNVYEVNVRQYTPEGTFNAFSKHLPRLKDMGVQTLWFMPVTPIAQLNKKGSLGSYYAAADYTSINSEFGTLADFKSLVKEAQSIGFKVIIDWVANHTGWDHKWTWEHPDYYKKDEHNGFVKASGMDDIIELDFGNPQLREAMIEAMRFWIVETGIDGFRCDLAFWVELPFWIEAKQALEKDKKLFWLGELDPLERPEYMQVFDAAYSWTWMHKTEAFCKQQFSFHELEQVLDRYLASPGMEAWFTANHDENSWNGTEYEKYGDAAEALAVFSCTWPGIPLIYSGQELPNLKRLQFFEKDEIEWKGENKLHSFYQTLLKLRSENAALSGDVTVATLHKLTVSNAQQVLAYLRKTQEQEVLVLLNFSGDYIEVEITDEKLQGRFTDVFENKQKDFTTNRIQQLAPWGYRVFSK